MARKKAEKKRDPGVNVEVSTKAHRAMLLEALEYQPKKTLRQIVNIKNNIDENA